MFILEKKLPGNRIAFMINHSRREGKKVKSETIKYFGIAHNIEEQKTLRKLAKAELRKLSPKPKNKISDVCNMREKNRVIEGIHQIFGKEFDFLGLNDLFSKIKLEQLRDVVLSRIANPTSKLHTSRILKNLYQKKLSEDQIYRMMDDLTKKESAIQIKIFEATQNHSSQKDVNLLFFDVTTLYFESQKSDELKNFGYSKDHKIGEVQIVLALATTDEGLPVGYQLFPGNTAETTTLLQSINQWRENLSIKKVRVIADRGMMSDKNLSKLEQEKLEYIIASKLRSLPKKLKEEILEFKKSIRINTSDSVIVKEFTYRGRRLVVGYNKSRADKDRSDRERTISKLKNKLNNGKTKTRKLITNNGYLRYLDEAKSGEVIVNEEKILEEEKWDGLHGKLSNNYELTPIEIINQYKRLWIIEESFRLNKHSLSMRPIYHYKPRRIKSHILICYLAFAVSRFVPKKVNSLSFEKIREELLQIEASIVEDQKTGKCYRIPSAMSSESAEIYKKMHVKRSIRPSLCCSK